MTDITIEAGGFPHYQGPTNVEIWIVANKPFVTPDGKPISAGSVAEAAWMVRVVGGITVAGNVLQLPEIVVDATEDAINGWDATLSAFVVTPQGRPVSALSVFRNFKVPASPSSMSWAQLAAHNSSVLISPPATPDAPVATAINAGQVDVVIAGMVGAVSYKLFRSTNGGAFTLHASGLSADTYQDMSSVSPLTDYAYKVIGSNLGGESAESATSNTVTTPQVAAPGAPVLSGSVSGAAVHLTTTATPRSTSYLIYRNKNSAGYFLLTTSAVSTGAALDYHDTDLADGDNVSYKVKASNAGGDSGYSNVVSQSVAVTPVDPLTLSPMIWIDGETGGYSAGDVITSIADQSSHGNNITINGSNAIFRTAPIKYFENTLPSGRFTLGSELTTARQVVMVYRMRTGAEQDLGEAVSCLIADNTNSVATACGPIDPHRLSELFVRSDFPSGTAIDAGLIGAGATVKFSGGSAIPKIPQMESSWVIGGTWVHPSTVQYAATRDHAFVIVSFKTSANVKIDTLLSQYAIPNTGLKADLAAFGAWSTPLSSGDEGGIIAFLNARYSLTTSPEQHIYIGDSLTYGAGVVANNGIYNLPNVVQVDNHTNGLLSGAINLGVGSAPLLDATTNAGLYYMYRNYWKNLRDPQREKQIIVLWIGANDIAVAGQTGSQIYTNTAAFCNEARADGFKVLVICVPPSRFTAGGAVDLTNYATQRNAYLAAMTADHSFADGYLDYSARADIGVNTAPDDHPENFNDGIHLNAAGYAILAPLVGAALRAIP